MKMLISFLVFVTLVGGVYAFGFGDENYGLESPAVSEIVNYSIQNTNSSDYWDSLNTINTTQMEDNGGVLNILESWVQSLVGVVSGVKSGSPPYLYNDSDTMYFNETHLNATIDLRASGLGDNASWNQSYADTLYWDINDGSYNSTYDAYVTANYTNKSNYWDNMNTINTTQMENSGGVLNILVSWLTSLFYTKTEVNTTILQEGVRLGFNDTYNTTYDAYSQNVSYGDIFVNESGDNITGNINMQSGANITFDGAITIYYNGSGLIIE